MIDWYGYHEVPNETFDWQGRSVVGFEGATSISFIVAGWPAGMVYVSATFEAGMGQPEVVREQGGEDGAYLRGDNVQVDEFGRRYLGAQAQLRIDS